MTMDRESGGPAVMTCDSCGSRRLDAEQLDVEDQGCARRNHAARTPLAVAKLRGNDERALFAHLHARDALLPAGDHPTLTQREREGLAPVARAIELPALVFRSARVVQPAGVMHDGALARLDGGALSGFDFADFQLRGRGRGRCHGCRRVVCVRRGSGTLLTFATPTRGNEHRSERRGQAETNSHAFAPSFVAEAPASRMSTRFSRWT